MNSDLKNINDLIEKIYQIPEKDEEKVLNYSILISNASEIIPEPYRSIMLFWISIQLRSKKWALINRVNNDIETEKDFRRTCALYDNLASDPLFSHAYQEYINAYHKLTSNYHILNNFPTLKLFIYNTENENEEVKVLDLQRPVKMKTKNIIKFPNGDLLLIASGIFFIIDESYQINEILAPSNCRHAIYFNKSIYYFIKKNDNDFSWRFDLDTNLWSRFAAVPVNKYSICSSIIFNGNIIISRLKDSYLLSYSINIDSFSHIPYEFGLESKTLIKVEERLYMIDSDNDGNFYESEVGNPYCWYKIVFKVLIHLNQLYCSFNWGLWNQVEYWNQIIGHNVLARPKKIYCLYNRGQIYISSCSRNSSRNYYKFDLSSKVLIDIAHYRSNLALKQLDDKIWVIDPSGTSQLNPEFADFCYDKGESLDYLADAYDKLITSSMDIKQKCSNIAKAYYNKGNALHQLGKNLEAIECFDQATKLDPELQNDPNIKFEIADTLNELGRYQKAINYIDQLIKLGYNYSLIHLKKGINFHDWGKYAKAIEYYKEAKKSLSSSFLYYEICFRKGYALYNLGKNSRALECYNKAIKSDPKCYLYFFSRGNLFNDLGQEAEALKDFIQAYDIFYESYSMLNKILDKHKLELLRIFVNLQGCINDIQDKLEGIKDKSLESRLFKEYKTKWQEFKVQHLKIFKRAVECLDGYKLSSIKKTQQTIKKTNEHQWALISIFINSGKGYNFIQIK